MMRTFIMHRLTSLGISAALAAAAATLSCSRGSADTAPPNTGPVYAIATTVFGPDSDLTYLLTVPSLAPDTEPDYDRAVAIDGFASLFGREGRPDVYIGSGESPEIQRWTLGADGSLTPGGVVSFAGAGIKSAGQYPEYVQFISDTKAYLYDFASAKLLVWNPEAMTFEGEIALPLENRGTLQPAAGDALVLRPDGVLLVGIHWSNFDTQELGDAVRVVAVDTRSDRVLGTYDDTRCSENYSTTVGEDGTTYFSGGPWAQVTRDKLGAPYGGTPCHLRVVPPDVAWDEGYSVDMRALTGGRPTGEFLLVAPGRAFLRVFHEEDAPAFDGDIQGYLAKPAFRWWTWTLGEAEAQPVPNQEAAVSGGLRYRVDGKTYVTNSSADYSRTTLTELSAERGITPGMTVRGYPYGVVRLR